MKKYENARIVTFKEDYRASATGDVRYKKDSKHAIDKGLVEKLKKNGAKLESERLNFKEIEEKRKAQLSRKAA